MATNSLTRYTISDLMNSYSSLDGNAMYVKAANVMALKCPLFRMLPMYPTNQVMSEIYSKISAMGSASLRRFNEYIVPTVNKRTPGTEPIAMFQDWSEVDSAMCDMQNDPIQWRMDEDSVKIESMTQSVEDQFLNGNMAQYPAGINGLFTRYNLSTRRPNGIYPKNTRAGINLENKGKVTSESSTGRMDVYRTKVELFFGLVARDDRCVQMVRNIEVSGTDYTFNSALLSSALRRLPGGGQDPNTIILVSPTVMDQLDQMADDKHNVRYTPDEVFGGFVTRYKGVPVYMAEKISEAQTAIS